MRLPIHLVDVGVIIVFGMISICILYLLYLCERTRQNQQEQLNTTIQLLKLKRKTKIILLESSQIEPIITPMWFGKENSSVNITTIISPSCKHCRKVVFELLLLIEKGVQFRWNVVLGKMTRHDSEKIKIWVQKYISDKNKFSQDLYLWSNVQIQSLQCVQKTAVNDVQISKICNDFDTQIERLNISIFPQIILNNRLLSSIYTIRDLEFIIADMSQWKQ